MATLLNYLPAFLLFIHFIPTALSDLSVAHFGARGDGKTDASKSFLRAWTAACKSSLPTTIYVPPKSYFLRSLIFQGPCKSAVTFKMAGMLIAPDYAEMGSSQNWLTFNLVEGVTVEGGSLEGQGAELWSCKTAQSKCPAGATV